MAGYWIVERYRCHHLGRTGLRGPAAWPYLAIGVLLLAVLVVEQRRMGWSANLELLGVGLLAALVLSRRGGGAGAASGQ